MSARLSGLMNVHRRWLCTFGTLAVALAAGAAVPGLDQYDVFQYINLQGPSPAKIARLDTNGQVLFACRQATSRDALRDAGVTFSESQIQLLEVMGLLREHDGFLITTFPILEPADTSRLRAVAAKASAAIFDQVTLLVTSVKGALERDSKSDHAFAVVFSYVLDGLVWQQLNSMVPAATPPASQPSNPFWSGQLWAVSPKRSDTVGTNTDHAAGQMLYVVWSPQAKSALAPIYQPGVDARTLLSQIASNGQVTDAATRAAYSTVGILDADGRPLIPTITRRLDDPIQRACKGLADVVVRGTLGQLDLQQLAHDYHLQDRRTAVVIVYHELMWDLLDRLEKGRILVRPAVLGNGPADQPRSCTDIAFIVRDATGD